jgi:hypothetical protein
MSEPVVTCPHCLAVNNHGASQCFLCDRSLAGIRPDAKAQGVGSSRRGGTFHLATMMVVIALIAVYLGLFVTMPGLALVLAIPGVIALVRALMLPGRYSYRDPSVFDYMGSFFGTFAVVVMLMISSLVAFCATCLGIASIGGAGFRGGDAIGEGLACGSIAAIAVIIAFCAWLARLRRADGPPTQRRD